MPGKNWKTAFSAFFGHIDSQGSGYSKGFSIPNALAIARRSAIA